MAEKNDESKKDAIAPKIFHLKKGELLFSEGDQSKSMFFLREGQIRVFKKKGSTAIEIDTIRSGQIIGELAFLDGNPRSASCEAISDSQLVEISGPTFTQTLLKMPDWVKLLLKTVVGRLRAASTKIKQLETAVTQVDYSSSVEGKKSYVYMTYYDALKVGTALLLVAARNKEAKKENGVLINIDHLHKYAKSIIGVPESKITSFLDVLQQVGLMKLDSESEMPGFYLTDIEQLEKAINFICEQNLALEEKKKTVGNKGYLIMGFISKHLAQYTPNKETGIADVNLAEIIKIEKEALQGRDPFRYDDCEELIQKGIIGLPKFNSNDSCISGVNTVQFNKLFQYLRVLKAIDRLNEEKRSHIKVA